MISSTGLANGPIHTAGTVYLPVRPRSLLQFIGSHVQQSWLLRLRAGSKTSPPHAFLHSESESSSSSSSSSTSYSSSSFSSEAADPVCSAASFRALRSTSRSDAACFALAACGQRYYSWRQTARSLSRGATDGRAAQNWRVVLHMVVEQDSKACSLQKKCSSRVSVMGMYVRNYRRKVEGRATLVRLRRARSSETTSLSKSPYSSPLMPSSSISRSSTNTCEAQEVTV